MPKVRLWINAKSMAPAEINDKAKGRAVVLVPSGRNLTVPAGDHAAAIP